MVHHLIRYISLIGIIFISACSGKTRQTPSGMKFKVIRQGEGRQPQVGEVVIFDYLLKDSRDSVWASSSGTFPGAIIIDDSSRINEENGLIQMMRMLSKGDSVVVNMSANEFYSKMSRGVRPSYIDPALRISYRFRINDIMNSLEYTQYEQKLMEEFYKRQTSKETGSIDSYLAKKNIKPDTTQNGIRYVMIRQGSGPLAQSGQTVIVNYKGYFMNGQYFDTNLESFAKEAGIFFEEREYKPMRVTIDKTNVIPGWHEALKYLNKGALATFYIPSAWAYGASGMGNTIKPNTILVFDIELLEIVEETKGKN